MKNVTFDDVFGQSQREGWQQPPVRCPHCGQGVVYYDVDDPDHYEEAEDWLCSCTMCDKVWHEPFNSPK